eukprot:scaffold196527_cov22-Tisochrysis_lutea.AAC.1
MPYAVAEPRTFVACATKAVVGLCEKWYQLPREGHRRDHLSKAVCTNTMEPARSKAERHCQHVTAKSMLPAQNDGPHAHK